jgi:hypothetical protein
MPDIRSPLKWTSLNEVVANNERPTLRQLESSVSFSYLNMNEIYVKLNEEMKNANPTDSFGLTKLLKRKSYFSRLPPSKRFF